MTDQISNLQQKVGEAYGKNFDRIFRGGNDSCWKHPGEPLPCEKCEDALWIGRCQVCGGELDEDGNCKKLIEQQRNR